MSTIYAPADDVTVANNALALIGAPPISAIDEDSDEARNVVSVYADVVETILCQANWIFAQRTFALSAAAETPTNGWARAHILPPQRVGGVCVVLTDAKSRQPLRDFSIEGGIVYSDRDNLWATVGTRPAVNLWPAPFRRLVTVALASALAVPTAHDASLAAQLGQQAFGNMSEQMRGGLFALAIGHDLRSHPGPQPIGMSDPLTGAWHGGL